jgi:two-component system, NtrC family, response regulator HydG
LDEVGDLGLPLQAKLLRVLQEKRIKRVGENHDRAINCRIISATHKDLSEEVKAGRFREDLFFRLNVVPITIPPLRDRPEDLMSLAETFLRRFALANNSLVRTFSADAMAFLLDNKWRGNVRELENTMERAVALCPGSEVSLAHFIPTAACLLKVDAEPEYTSHDENIFSFKHLDQLPRLEDVINRYITYAIHRNGGARDKTAKDIGIDRKTLYRRMNPNDADTVP